MQMISHQHLQASIGQPCNKRNWQKIVFHCKAHKDLVSSEHVTEEIKRHVAIMWKHPQDTD